VDLLIARPLHEPQQVLIQQACLKPLRGVQFERKPIVE